jgi:hypothetical protein
VPHHTASHCQRRLGVLSVWSWRARKKQFGAGAAVLGEPERPRRAERLSPCHRSLRTRSTSSNWERDVLGIDSVWREYHVFANRADAELSVIGFEAEGFRAKIYRTASSWPIEEDVQDNHHRRHT